MRYRLLCSYASVHRIESAAKKFEIYAVKSITPDGEDGSFNYVACEITCTCDNTKPGQQLADCIKRREPALQDKELFLYRKLQDVAPSWEYLQAADGPLPNALDVLALDINGSPLT
eukprot:GHVU01074546.1.p6 GENE.GHVU01074546.1~~GHVU01074546.1.p6  ORF type:complete len:116 (+),score=15.49 GHVU01074546.1:252-599(+)